MFGRLWRAGMAAENRLCYGAISTLASSQQAIRILNDLGMLFVLWDA